MVKSERLAKKDIYISCIVPAHNEAEVIQEFMVALSKQLESLTSRYEIIFVDDGSSDDTVAKVKDIADKHCVKQVIFSRNFGKEIAITAGLEHCAGDVAIIIDADFQHPIDVIPTFLDGWKAGYDMVYGVRNSREGESHFKKRTVAIFYRFMHKIINSDLPADAGDFRLLDRKIVDVLKKMPEQDRFMKGLYGWVGFTSQAVPFDVQKRKAGKTSFSLFKLFELALTGLTSFSNVPLRVWSFVGFVMSCISFVYGAYVLFKTLILGVDTPGYATLIVAIMFFGGIQLLSVGVLGEYIARIFTEVKQRPMYIVAEKEGFDE